MNTLPTYLTIPFKRLSRLLFLFLLLLLLLAHESVQTGYAAATPGALQSLYQQATNAAAVRVIVQLDLPFIPETELPDARGVQIQQTAIAALQQSVATAVADTGATVVAEFSTIPFMALEADAAALERLAGMPEVVAIVEDLPIPAAVASSIPVIGADTAWQNGFTGEGQTVAILDTGIDTAHSAFNTGGSRIVAEACFSTTSALYGATTVCPGGYESQIGPGSGADCTAAAGAGNSYAQSDCAHGTHVASIAAGDNGGGVVGVAPDANIIAVQIFSLFNNAEYCSGYPDCALTFTSDQILALEHIYALRDTYNIAAVNLSVGGGQYAAACDSDARKAIIDNLSAAGIATVVAAGNSGYRDSLSAPACISSAISVGATTDIDEVASYSNIAPFLDMLAPGSSIYAAVPNGYDTMQGTSMATPHVTGAWALYKEHVPGATVHDVRDALRDTGTMVADERSGGTETGLPRINIDQAIDEYVPQLLIAVAADSGYAIPGQSIDLTVTVTNVTAVTASEVVLQTAVPPATTLITAGLSSDAAYTGTQPGGQLSWQIAQPLPSGTSVSREFSLMLAANAGPGLLNSTVLVTAGGMGAEAWGTAVISINDIAQCDINEGFESGELASYWSVSGTNDGRTAISQEMPSSGNYHLVLDDAVDGGDYSEAHLTMTIDLSAQEQVDLSFDLQNLGDEYHPDFDGVFIRDDFTGGWVKIYDFQVVVDAGYQNQVVDLTAEAGQNGLTLNNQFQIRFSFYDNFSFNPANVSGGDGYSLDNIVISCNEAAQIERAPVDPHDSETQVLVLANGMLTLTIPPGSLPDAAAEIEYAGQPANSVSSIAGANAVFALNLLDSSGDVIPEPLFNDPLTLLIHYNDSWEEQGLEEMLSFKHHDLTTGNWELLPIAVHDMAADCLQIELHHFSEFALLGPQQVFLPMAVR